MLFLNKKNTADIKPDISSKKAPVFALGHPVE